MPDHLPGSSTACYQDCISVLVISIAILVDMYRENPLV